MNYFLQPQTIAALGAINRVYSQQFTLEPSADGITPVSGGSDSISIQSGHHFFTEYLLCGFPTVTDEAQEAPDPPVTRDNGVCYQTLLLKTNQLASLFSNPILLSMIGVPGRQPFPGALTADGTQPPMGQAPHIYGFPFKSFLAAGSDFIHTFANISTTPNVVISINWYGWDFSDAKIPDAKTFWDIVSRYQAPPFVT